MECVDESLLEQNFLDQGAKMSNGLQKRKISIWISLSGTVKPFQNQLNRYLEIATSHQNEHVYVICCRPEVDSDITSCWNIKTNEGYVVVNFAAASSSSFREILKNHFVTVAADNDDSVIIFFKTYILYYWNSQILHVLNNSLFFLWYLSMLNQLRQVLFGDTFKGNQWEDFRQEWFVNKLIT